MIYNALSTLFKFVVVAVFVGAVLKEFNISTDAVLADIGLTPDHIMQVAREGFDWALPNLILGALVLIPIWLIIFLLKPPRLGK
jgi:hypothetical protein